MKGAGPHTPKRQKMEKQQVGDPNTAVKIRGCFIGIPGKRDPKPAEKGDMDLARVLSDLHFVSSEWWASRSRPEIANSDRSVWGMHD